MRKQLMPSRAQVASCGQDLRLHGSAIFFCRPFNRLFFSCLLWGDLQSHSQSCEVHGPKWRQREVSVLPVQREDAILAVSEFLVDIDDARRCCCC